MILKKSSFGKISLVVFFGLSVAFLLSLSNNPASAASNCGFNTTKSGSFTINNAVVPTASCTIYANSAEGIVGTTGDVFTVAAGKTIILENGAQLAVSPNVKIDMSQAGAVINMAGQEVEIIKGTLCGVDNDGDGYFASSTPSQTEPFWIVNKNQTTCPSGYTSKGAAISSLTQLDCFDNDPTRYKQDCVLSAPSYGGSWANVGTCGQYTAGKQKQSRNWTKTVTTPASSCGGVGCGAQSGTDYQDVNCDCSSGDCCDTSSGIGLFRPSSYSCRASAGTCDVAENCTGSNATCPADSVRPSTYVCSTGSFNNPADGSCTRTATDTKCTGSGTACNGATSTRYDYGSNGQVWYTSAWRSITSTYKCSISAANSCSGQQPQGDALGCNGSGSCSYTSATKINIGAACSGGENSRCVSGTCTNQCSDGLDNDGDGYIDGQDTDCGGYGQCTSGVCCIAATGQYRTAGWHSGIGLLTCQKCSGTSATPINQTSSEDLGGECSTGAAGGSTACRSTNCSGSSAACGYLNSATTCRASAGVCDIADNCTGSAYACPADTFRPNTYVCSTGSFNNPASGSCQRTATDTKCTGTSALCTGSTATRYENAPTAGNVWNGSAWAAASCSVYCSLSSPFCSSQQVQTSARGCNTSGSCDNVTARATCNGTLCPGGENSRCVSGTCTNQCSDGIDNDGDGYTDGQDTDCGAVCTAGVCCNTATGQYRTAGWHSGIGLSTCQKCSGTSATPVNQTSSEDLGNECTTGAAGGSTACRSANCSGTGASCGYLNSATTCRASAGACDVAENCTGSADACPVNAYLSNANICSLGAYNNPADGSCARSATNTYCSGSSALCNGSTSTVYDYGSNGQVWYSSAWRSVTSTYKCGISGANSCSGQQPQGNAMGCNGSGSCSYTSSTKVNVGSACLGKENSLCDGGSCLNKCFAPYHPTDNDGDGFDDNQDPDCGLGGCGQCTSGACCNTTTACYLAANTCVPTCQKCTGSSATAVLQTSGEDLCNECTTGAAGGSTACRSANCSGSSAACGYLSSATTCRSSAGTCDVAENCTGSSAACPTDAFRPNTYVCSTCSPTGSSGACQLTGTGLKCTGTSNSCSVSYSCPTNAPTFNTIWNGSSWVTASCALNCGYTAVTCSGSSRVRGAYGCNTSGSCSTTQQVSCTIENCPNGCSGGSCISCTPLTCNGVYGCGNISDGCGGCLWCNCPYGYSCGGWWSEQPCGNRGQCNADPGCTAGCGSYECGFDDCGNPCGQSGGMCPYTKWPHCCGGYCVSTACDAPIPMP